MKRSASLIALIALFVGINTFANPTDKDKADAAQINTACADDAKTAGCGGEVVGKGLLKCLHKYKHAQKKTNKSFSYSAACEAAMHQLHDDKKAGK